MIVKVLCHFPAGELMFASENIQDDGPTEILEHGGNWQNKIVSISSLNRNIGEDKSYEISGISVEFNDTDRFFREMMSASHRYIAGNRVELFTEDDQLIYTGTVEKWQFTEDAFVLYINDKLSGLDTLLTRQITVDDYPNMAEESDGKSIPIIYGDVWADGGAVNCWRIDSHTVVENSVEVEKGIYLAAGHHCKSIDAVFDKDGIELDLENDFEIIEEGTFGQPDAKTLLKYTGTGEFPAEFIRIDAKGKMDGQSNLIEDPIDAVKDIIDQYTDMGYDTEGMDAAQAIMADREYKIAAVIDKQQSLKEVLVDFCFSFDCDFYIGKGNEITVTLLKWSEMTPVKRFIQSQVVGFKMDELPEEIRNKVRYQYRYNFAVETYKKSPIYTKDSSIANWGEFYNRNEALDLKFVSDDDSAFDVVQRYVIQRKNPRRVAQVDIPLSEFSGLDISDIIEIQHPGAINAGNRKYQVRRVNIDFVAEIVQVEAVDITTMTGGVFVLGNKYIEHDTWETADAGERNYGYLADSSTGYFSNLIDYGKVLY